MPAARKWFYSYKACAECGHEFLARTPHSTYCTIACQKRAAYHRRATRDHSATESFTIDELGVATKEE